MRYLVQGARAQSIQEMNSWGEAEVRCLIFFVRLHAVLCCIMSGHDWLYCELFLLLAQAVQQLHAMRKKAELQLDSLSHSTLG